MRTAHKICNVGEWTEAAGDVITDTKCTPCSTGRFRGKAPTDSKAENEVAVCIVHSICKAGEWTKASGNAFKDTTCVSCKAGTFRDKGPINTIPEQEANVCKPPTTTTTTAPAKKCVWGQGSADVKCNQAAGEVRMRKSSVMTSSLEKCKKSCEDTAGCRSITYFKTNWCTHFSTPCTNTKGSGMAGVERLVAPCKAVRTTSKFT